MPLMVPVNGEAPHSEPALANPVHGPVALTKINSMFPVRVPAVILIFKEVPVATKLYHTSGWLLPDWQPTVPSQLSLAPTVVPL